MNKKLQNIFARRTIRLYDTRPVAEDLVRDLLEAAMAAPSSGGKSPWRFVVVRDKGSLKNLASGLPNGQALETASVGIVVCGDSRESVEGQISPLLQDTSASIENLLLAASALGLGACWLGVHPYEDRVANIRKVLGVPEEVVPIAAISVGWPAEELAPRTQYSDAFVHHERW